MSTLTTETVTTRLGLFEQATSYTVDVLTTVEPTDLDLPTPCKGWDVRDVVLHLADVSDAVIDLTVTGALTMPTPCPRSTAAPVAVAVERIAALRETLTVNADVAAELLMGAAQGGANELAAHAWDIATALGLDRPIPAETASALLALIDGHLDAAARGGNFAAAVPMPSSADPSDRFVAYLGRRPRR